MAPSPTNACPASPIYPPEMMQQFSWQAKPDGNLFLQHGGIVDPETGKPLFLFGQAAIQWLGLTDDQVTAITRIRFSAKGVPYPNREDFCVQEPTLAIRWREGVSTDMKTRIEQQAFGKLQQVGYGRGDVQYNSSDDKPCCGLGCYGCIRYGAC